MTHPPAPRVPTRRGTSRAVAALLSLLVLAPGCDPAESVSPAPLPTAAPTGAGAAGGSSGAGGSGGAPAPKPIRTVEQRNPFGDVAAKDNLLWDGDFEWSSPFADGYGWLFGPPYSYDFTPPTIGAACRSGIKCVTLPPDKGVIGLGVGSGKGALLVSLFAKPQTLACADVDVTLLDPIGNTADVAIPEESDKPDEQGWCHYVAKVASHPHSLALLVDNPTSGQVLVDDAVVRREPPRANAPLPPVPPAPPMRPPAPERQLRHDEARAAVERLRAPHDRPPSAARRAFEEQSQ